MQCASVQRLMELGPDIVVCEVAGCLLSVWKDAPHVQHIFLIAGGELHLFPHVAIDLPLNSGAELAPFTIGALGHVLRGHKSARAAIPLVPDTICRTTRWTVWLLDSSTLCFDLAGPSIRNYDL